MPKETTDDFDVKLLGGTALRPAGVATRRRKKSAAGSRQRQAATRKSSAKKKTAAAGTLAGWLHKSPPWLVSTLLHVAVVITLALISIAALPESDEFKIASSFEGVEEELDDFVEIELEELEETEVELVTFETPALEMSDLMPAELESITPIPDMAASFEPSDMELSGLGDSLKQGGSASGATTSFFGAKSRGDRVVFIVDASNSMVKGRMETSLRELIRSVGAMTKQQSFYVILFSDQAYPMFFPDDPTDKMLEATPRNKEKLATWLPTIELCVGGSVFEAVEMAADLRPHVVYLLSDGGNSQTDRLIARKDSNGWRFVINTLGMTVRNEVAKERMVALASAYGGVFRPVSIHPAAARMSKERPIKKNSQRGDVWGTKVRVRAKK